MSEKLHNSELDATHVSGTATNSNDPKKGNSNKIKLKMTSYAVIMEVQEAFMQEELEKQNEELNKLEASTSDASLTDEEQKEINSNIASLKADIDSMKKVYDEFSNARVRFTEMSKKALKVHEDNIEQMKENDEELAKEPELKADFSTYKEAQKVLKDAQEANIFSNVDSEAIKEEVNRVMSEKTIEDNKENRNNNNYSTPNITSDNFSETITSIAQDVKATPSEKSVLSTPLSADAFLNEGLNIGGSGDIFDGSTPASVEESGLNVINFDDDKSIEAYLNNLEKETDRLKATGDELTNKLSNLLEEKTMAAKKQEEAKQAREEAERKYKEALRQKDLLNSYKPEIDKLRRIMEEQASLNSDKEDELRRENEALTGIYSKTNAIEAETTDYDKKTSAILNELKELRKEFAGTPYNGGDSPIIGGEGGRKK